MNDPAFLTCLAIALVGLFWLAAIVGVKRRRRDPQRLFTWSQKRELLAQASHRCEHKLPLWRRCPENSRLEADHVVPWSRGGPTQLWNGQVLCRRHNRRKSNLAPTSLYRWRLIRRRKRYDHAQV